jgi:hypothetical protein
MAGLNSVTKPHIILHLRHHVVDGNLGSQGRTVAVKQLRWHKSGAAYTLHDTGRLPSGHKPSRNMTSANSSRLPPSRNNLNQASPSGFLKSTNTWDHTMAETDEVALKPLSQRASGIQPSIPATSPSSEPLRIQEELIYELFENLLTGEEPLLHKPGSTGPARINEQTLPSHLSSSPIMKQKAPPRSSPLGDSDTFKSSGKSIFWSWSAELVSICFALALLAAIFAILATQNGQPAQGWAIPDGMKGLSLSLPATLTLNTVVALLSTFFSRCHRSGCRRDYLAIQMVLVRLGPGSGEATPRHAAL